MTAFFSRTIERHAFGWLVAANVVGVWLAALLLWPGLGRITGPLGYGRWMPLHLDWQLYGWCALPLVGVLVTWLVTPDAAGRWHVRLALGAWSAALALGGVSWLAGVTSGKLFLDWHGWARPLLPVAMLVLWSVLALHAWLRCGEGPATTRWVRAVVLLGLLAVPNLLYWAAGREVYPAVNPHSGGATGASLLGSTLAIIAVFGALPALLRVPGRPARWYWAAFAVGVAGFVAADRGDASHHAPGQVAALAVLLPWVVLLPLYLRGFAWHAATRPWLQASLIWWGVLVATGFLVFLPGWSERLKFTHALVAHAHLAMAGLVTSLHVAILRQLRGGGSARGFWPWQAGNAVQVVILTALGWVESADPAALFLGEASTQAAYGIRLVAGVAMLLASIGWWRESGA